jgi:hypothetical protein
MRNWLRPVRASVLDSEELNAADFFPQVRNELIRWGGEVMALPLGIDRSVIEAPLKPMNSISLFAVAGPGVISNERLGVLFDIETMKPRIAEPVVIESLLQLYKSMAALGEEQLQVVPSVPVLGFNDRLAAVTSASRNAASAFKLLEWLAGSETSSQLTRGAAGQLPVRRSLASSAAWYEPTLSASDRAERGKMLSAMLSGERSFVIPRIPAIDEYLAALDEAVNSAENKNVVPAEALQEAAEKWEKITEAHGREKQRRAYQNHLGIE